MCVNAGEIPTLDVWKSYFISDWWESLNVLPFRDADNKGYSKTFYYYQQKFNRSESCVLWNTTW